jgi:predicted MFS family arabinose efflux permease
VGAAAFLALGLSHAALNAISSLFVIPLQQEFGWTRAEFAFVHNASLGAALVAPFLGRAVDRFGVRRLMLGGMTIYALLYLGFASMNGSLALFYTLATLSAVIGLTSSGLTCSRVISEAFPRSLGFSLAAARSGLSFTGAVLPALIYAIIASYGWRAAYLAESALVLLVALPAVYFWIERSPSDGGRARARPAAEMPRWGALFSNPKVLVLCLAAAFGYGPAFAVMSQLQPILIGEGVNPGQAASLVGAAGLASFAGALITGVLIDRFWAPAIALIFMCGAAAGAALLALNGSVDTAGAMVAILLIGLGLGAELDLVAFMVARYVGVANFSSVYGLIVVALAVGGASGASLLGLAYDNHGNYDLALLGVSASFIVAGLLYLTLGRYPDQARQEPSHAPIARAAEDAAG